MSTRSSRSLVLDGQLAHALLLVALAVATVAALRSVDGARSGTWLGWSTDRWVLAALVVPAAHQIWVWLWWRLELHLGWWSRRLGRSAFRVYAAGFAVLGVGRVLAVVGLAVANRSTVPIPSAIGWAIAAVLTVPVAWLLVSIARHFGFDHALGADHFFEEHRTRGLCREGIFRHVPNAMYTVGFFLFWIPAVGLASAAALLLAAFNHCYIWVHYFCTERPDMRRIY